MYSNESRLDIFVCRINVIFKQYNNYAHRLYQKVCLMIHSIKRPIILDHYHVLL